MNLKKTTLISSVVVAFAAMTNNSHATNEGDKAWSAVSTISSIEVTGFSTGVGNVQYKLSDAVIPCGANGGDGYFLDENSNVMATFVHSTALAAFMAAKDTIFYYQCINGVARVERVKIVP